MVHFFYLQTTFETSFLSSRKNAVLHVVYMWKSVIENLHDVLCRYLGTTLNLQNFKDLNNNKVMRLTFARTFLCL